MKVFIIAAMSADGYIGLTSDHLADWTTKEDKQLFIQLTKEAGVMIMGSSTAQTIGKGLPGRKLIVYTTNPKKFKDYTGDVETTSEDPKKLVARLKELGYSSVAICGGSKTYSHFLRSGIVDELYLTIEPILFGGGMPLLQNVAPTKLQLLQCKKLNDHTVLLHYALH